MTTIYVYGDESGTMPKRDADEPFVGATVAFLGEDPTEIPEGSGARWLASAIKELGGIAFFGYVQPRPGYEAALATRHSKMDTMARMQRLITGDNSEFIPERGLSLRNNIWGMCMSQAVAQIFAGALHRGTVDTVRILLDQKTLAEQDRNRFRSFIPWEGERFRTVLRGLPPEYQNHARVLEKRIGVTSETISVHWSDEPGANDAAPGLRLADHLAGLARQAIIDPSSSDLRAAFADEECQLHEMDLTDIVSRPLDKRVVETWRKKTGLPEPEA